MNKDYYLGLDMGTDSVGWSVANTDYTIPKFRGNAMWGIRLFDESNTAEERRGFRCARRRTQRSRERLLYLELLFNKEISKIDPAFFQRLKESSLYLEDKSVAGKYCVFNDNDFTDKDFHKKYPTIYHLRKDLIDDKSEKDIRLVYLALHHIIKNRGHFLFDDLNTDEGVTDFAPLYKKLKDYLYDKFELEISCNDLQQFQEILKDKTIGKAKKNAGIIELFNINKKDQIAYILSLLSGSSIKLCDIFDDDSLKEVEKKSITLSGNFDDTAQDYEAILGERFDLILILKEIYDWAILIDILGGENYISYSKVKAYEKHKSDLLKLKEYVKTYMPEKYNDVFKKTVKGVNNYVAYSGHSKKNHKTDILNESCTQEEFCEYLKKLLGSCKDDAYVEMFSEIELFTFMPKQVSKNNSVIPMQIHRAELIAILDNAKEYLPFLNETDSDNISIYDKVVSIFDYRIPYYVGPLNNHSGKYWVVRKEGKVYPWNIESIVDYDKSAEAFIENLTSKCTYLPEFDVIPKNSILYSKFMVLNELNNLKINGVDIDISHKQGIYSNLFEKKMKVRVKDVKQYLEAIGVEVDDITGIDGDFKSSLKPMLQMNQYNLDIEEKEEIIKAITIFGDDKKLLKKRLKNSYGNKLSDDEIKQISKLKFTGWSSLSKEFLTEVECVHKGSGEVVNIITALWQTNNNLMQLLYSSDFATMDDDSKTFIDAVKKMNSLDSSKSLSEIVDELYVSPKIKRPIYQSLLIAKEIEKIQKCPPKKIFIEVARGEEKKERKVSRKQRLIDLYKACKNECADLYASLNEKSEDDLRSDKLYLYYTQFGKCMYTGKNIDLDTLMSSNTCYDIDHIFPQSKVKDDSLDNRVLVDKVANENKGNDYPISSEVQSKMYPLWKTLYDKELISKKKFDRLTRKTQLSDDELSAFISRQLVETRQSTKAVAQIFEQLYPDTEIVYVKASLVSDFRHQYDMLKCREVNDFHHAKDAYLNIVVGNVYNVRFTHNKANFIKGLQMSGPYGYSLNKMFDFNVEGAWVTDNNKSMNIVKNTMLKNNIRYTRYSFEQHGGFFDQMPVKKGKGQVPLKANGAISQIEKYGAYNSASSKYFSLVRYIGKKDKLITQLIPINAYKETDYLNNPNKFVSEIVGYDAQVVIPKIKYNSCIAINGFKMHLSCASSGGSQLAYKPAVQLIVSIDEELYIRNIVKYLSQFSYRPVNKYDHITVEENISLYEKLCEKLTSTIFSVKFGDLGKKLIDKLELFKSIEVEKQAYVLAEIIKILHCNKLSGDLTNINEAKNAGAATTNSKISEIKNITSVKLINQSITGLYENEVELLK